MNPRLYTRLTRRQFAWKLGVAGAALLAGCDRLPFGPRPAPRIARVGWLEYGTAPGPGEPSRVADFWDGLRALGHVEGRTIVVDARYADTDASLEASAAALAALPADVIVTAAGPATVVAVRLATTTIPIVMTGNTPDPIRLGFIESYARPGGNVTGVTSFPEGPRGGLAGKQLELLKEVTPGLIRVVTLIDGSAAQEALQASAPLAREAAEALGLELVRVEWQGLDDLEPALAAAGAGAPGRCARRAGRSRSLTRGRSRTSPSNIA